MAWVGLLAEETPNFHIINGLHEEQCNYFFGTTAFDLGSKNSRLLNHGGDFNANKPTIFFIIIYTLFIIWVGLNWRFIKTSVPIWTKI